MAKKILAWSNVASQFYREIGKKENGKAVRFYLGADEKKAMNNVTRLEALWDGVETRWKDLNSENLADTAFPTWDDVTLSLGRAICKGEWSITVEPPEDWAQESAVWLASLRLYFPMIQVQIENTSKVEEGNRAFIQMGQKMTEKEEARHREEMRQIKQIVTPYRGRRSGLARHAA